MKPNSIYNEDCRETMKRMPDNYVDAILTDPPYFLIDKIGSGFMGKKWDSISNLWRYLWLNEKHVNNVISLLKLARIEKGMGEVFIVQKNVNTSESKEKINGNVPFAINSLLYGDVQRKDSVLLLALTKQGVWDILKETSLSPIKILEEFLNGEKESALYVIPIISRLNGRNNIVLKNVTKQLKAKDYLEKEIIFTRTEILKIKNTIVAMDGGLLESRYIKEIDGNANIAVSTVQEKKYNVTISFPIMTEELTKNLILLLYVSLAMRESSEINKYLIKNFLTVTFQECLRILKPGGYCLAFGGTRTSHYLTDSIEDAGFEIRDCIMWHYGSGFPKSLDISKKIDQMKGAEREVVGKGNSGISTRKELRNQKGTVWGCDSSDFDITIPTTPEAKQWDGWGTALKPATEIITMARKPLSEKTITANVLKWGTGGINVDGCRVELDSNIDDSQLRKMKRTQKTNKNGWGMNQNKSDNPQVIQPGGRFPSNLIHDGSEEVVGLFPETKSGTILPHHKAKESENKCMSGKNYERTGNVSIGDSGSAARFFYQPKASRWDRDEGLEGVEEMQASGLPMRKKDGERGGKGIDGTATDRKTVRRNIHPTVKPTELMRYLCRLVTPPGGIVYDPFMGSGSTGIAAILENFKFIGSEINEEDCIIAEKRIDFKPLFKVVFFRGKMLNFEEVTK